MAGWCQGGDQEFVNKSWAWPSGKRFAFSVFDDTDLSTVENVGPVYDLLADLGFRTTKSVWPMAGPEIPRCGGGTCSDEGYRKWAQSLQARGFEIGYHLATYHTSRREESIRGLDLFREYFGHDPAAMANHTGCQEGVYWGADRLTGALRLPYALMLRLRHHPRFRGHLQGDPLFWGDVCKARLKYVRNFQFQNINTLAACPEMPYHDPSRPFVNYWFASSEGAEVNSFNRTLGEAQQERLEEEGGACIMYTHFACGFWESGQLNARFRTLMERLARRNGWFVPVTTLLDHLLEQRGPRTLTSGERRSLEYRWLSSKIKIGPS